MNKIFSKPFLLLLPLFLVIISCSGEKKTTAKLPETNTEIEVIYFYGKQRCVTCKKMEMFAREVVDKDFVRQKEEGKISFKSIDINTPEGEEIADMFEVASSALFIVDNNPENPQKIDMTPFGFKNAKNNQEVFKQGLVDKINSLLK